MSHTWTHKINYLLKTFFSDSSVQVEVWFNLKSNTEIHIYAKIIKFLF